MKIKDKFAALLRRWASKLSPETRTHYGPGEATFYLPSPFGVDYYEVRRVAMEYRISRSEEEHAVIAQQRRYYPDAVEGLRNEYKERITHGIIAAIWERGIVEFTEERDPDTNELRIRGSLYVGIRKDNENINPFNN